MYHPTPGRKSNTVPKLPPPLDWKLAEHSNANNPVNNVATAPNHAGMRQHTSFKFISTQDTPMLFIVRASKDTIKESSLAAWEAAEVMTTLSGMLNPNL
jgi:hypothetical protein